MVTQKRDPGRTYRSIYESGDCKTVTFPISRLGGLSKAIETKEVLRDDKSNVA